MHQASTHLKPTAAVPSPEELAVRQRDLRGADAQPRINRVCGAQDIGVDGSYMVAKVPCNLTPRHPPILLST
jgi:hypothetical protein